ncbi:hypothetical protein LUI11_21350 [Bradyrhizobium diazoefficiens]|uniref:Glycosyltransferase RgtA/B/C/D-like domain-containing protein n=1 Tax=Bradyrhizobium diazoefficiens SEMIA 5080 TaxID=754504 RepID=A0A837C2W0_9BRAD|nr:hypothetical protein [Bradyrhizobium diazoefficiens]APO56089.1 hypothetical protein BD122_37395 [Bradyrhizobium diazoefficiens]KGJ63502.1 hypothetical protein BJA5080_05299 [Bradyrhizobium diazoefficiens SEMIA 5080]KOY05592.1 membrane protein [Bradyrhizobium diazoefficiens]MCD9291490.1 hypothetical protein [Bradyrhizobium diazoefficiens]MCD9809606.1 hypothetical protein [Bradyrhizobium diazoefficiens]
MSLSFANSIAMQGRARALVPLCVGAGAYLFFLYVGDTLLQDSDSFWQIRVGQWILDHGAVPTTDFYSFTRAGAPWISTSWLSQVLLAFSHAQWDWAGPVILTAMATALTAAIFVYLLDAQIEAPRAVLFAMLALLLSLHHVLARPHILALPVMVAWVGLLMAAADRRRAPSWYWLPLMALWANLHGGFVLGLALIGPISLEAVEHAEKGQRLRLFMRWVLFGIGAVIASCCTPYGWKTLLGATNILSLGELLSLIFEWMPANFATFTSFEGALLGLIAFGYYRGLVLSAPRIFLILFLTWSALTHVRSIEAFAFLVPLVLAKPLGELVPRPQPDSTGTDRWPAHYVTALGALMIVAAGWTSTSLYMGHHRFTFTMTQTPVAAVDLLEQRKVQRIFNAYQFGGYLISRDIPVYVDGRAELYGEKFVMDFFKATEGKKPELLPRLLDEYKIDATLLVADAPGPQILDQLTGWKRIYADDIAVIHVRDDSAAAKSSK